MTTPQEKMQITLAKTGIPFKRIDCYGLQVVVTCHSRDAAQRWMGVVTKFCRRAKSIETVDYAAHNKNTVLKPSTVKVWRVFGTV